LSDIYNKAKIEKRKRKKDWVEEFRIVGIKLNEEHGLLGHIRSLAFLRNKEYKIGREKDEKELRIVDIRNEMEINNIKYRL
jgi:hypothetical protein